MQPGFHYVWRGLFSLLIYIYIYSNRLKNEVIVFYIYIYIGFENKGIEKNKTRLQFAKM